MHVETRVLGQPPDDLRVGMGTPSVSYRLRHRLIVGVLVLSRRMIYAVDTPFALSNTIRALRTTFCGVFPFRITWPKSTRSFSLTTILLLVLITRSTS